MGNSKTKTNSKHVEQVSEKLKWKVHVANLIKETIDNNPSMWATKMPFQIFMQILYELGGVAARINDDELNAIMCRLTIYEIADKQSNSYDKDIVEEIYRKAEIAKKKRKNKS